MKKATPTVYVKDKIVKHHMDVDYFKGKAFGIETAKFNFTSSAVKEPYGDICFTTGYDNNDDYTSTFLMTAQEAMDLGKMLIDTAYEAMNTKRIIQDAESYDAQLSFLVLKGLIDTIRITRSEVKLENYERPNYEYIVSAYKDDKKILSYATVYNLSYFKSENEVQYWMDKLTDKGRIKLYTDNWDPMLELEQRKEQAQKELLKELDKINLKPQPIQKNNK